MSIARKKQLIKERIIAEYGKENPQDAKCIRTLQLIDLMDESDIPIGYWFLKMEEFSGSEHLQKSVLGYMEDITKRYMDGHSVCFVGNQGTGKTMSAICILKEAIKKGFTAHYTTASDVMSNMTSNRKMITRDVLRQADFLVIDEVDSRFFISDAQKELFSSIYEGVFRYRAHNTLPTIVCTNETDDIINVFYGQACQSINSLHSQYLKVYPVAGKDYRKVIK